MCAVLGADAPEAGPHAIDLGVAMQLTNIARDVTEDAVRDRLYLPAAWLPPAAPPVPSCRFVPHAVSPRAPARIAAVTIVRLRVMCQTSFHGV